MCYSSVLVQQAFELQLWHECFSVKFVEFNRKAFLQNTSGRSFLKNDFVFGCSKTSNIQLRHYACIILVLVFPHSFDFGFQFVEEKIYFVWPTLEKYLTDA